MFSKACMFIAVMLLVLTAVPGISASSRANPLLTDNAVLLEPHNTANPNAIPTAKTILNYLYSLDDPSRQDKRLIAGQFGAYGDGTGADTATAQLQKIHDKTGKWVALTGMDYKRWDMHHARDFSEPNQFLIDQWNQGALVSVSWHAANPWTDGPESDWDRGNGKPRSVRELITPGTAANKNWLAMLDDVAAGLKQLKDGGVVVIWRPFHEMNGGWFWWHQQTQADFVALWRHMFNYFTRQKGLDNLLWAYSPNTNNNKWNKGAAFFYPGAAYVDIVGLDHYMARGEDPLKLNEWHEYDDLAALGKPMGLLEFGPSPSDGSGWQDPKYDSAKLVRDIREFYPKIVFFQSWEYIWQLGDQDNVAGLFNESWIITRDLLPEWH